MQPGSRALPGWMRSLSVFAAAHAQGRLRRFDPWKQVMRAALERKDVEVVMYNDPFVDPEVGPCRMRMCRPAAYPNLALCTNLCPPVAAVRRVHAQVRLGAWAVQGHD